MKATASAGTSKRFIAGFLALIMVIMLVPFTASPVLGDVSEGYINSYADNSTLDGWKAFFGKNVPNTSNVGKIWTDKSVFTSVPNQFSGISKDENSLLVSLSALASNKEIKGYSTLPTDTMFILDLSGSMVSQSAIDDLVLAANASITQLLALNQHNRVGVVVYSYEVNTLLPLARYDSTATGYDADGNPIKIFLEQSGNANVHRKAEVFYEASGDPVTRIDAPQGGGTYIQGGVLAAFDQFNRDEIQPEIPDGEIQAGTNRTPIFVLMSDGAPTFASPYYATHSTPLEYGNGDYEYNAGVAFLTQLSNSYAYKKVWDKYQVEPLFYTLGMKVDDNDYAMSVLDPAGNVAEINQYWEDFVAPAGSNAKDVKNGDGSWTLNMDIKVQTRWGNDGATETITIQRAHPGFVLDVNYTTWLKDYVTKYYNADSASGLINSFKNIVEEIKVQARYYPTAVEYGSNPNIDGYVSFTDTIGEGMSVTDVKGLLVGGKLYTGKALSDAIGSSLGTVDNPTDLGNEFVWSVQARLGLDLATARALIGEAYKYGQLTYTSADPSCYIGWYADANGNYVGHWHKDMTTAPANATQIVRSYGFLGDTTGSIQGSNMMYVSVRVVENIDTGIQTVHFDIPAALVPLVTYSIDVSGKNYSSATATMVINEEEPIRLVYEVALDSEINEFNVIESGASVDENGNYQFWSNSVDGIEVEYTPSARNEYYYFVEDMDIVYFNEETGEFQRIYGVPELISPAYRYKEYIFEITSGTTAAITPTYTYVNMEKVIHAGYAKNDKIDPYIGVDYWYIPAGTAHHETDEPADILKTENISKTQNYVHSTVSVSNGTVTESLGNNGLITVTPAQGIRITKAIYQGYDPNKNNKFEFQITLTPPAGTILNNTYPAMIADAWQYDGVETTVNVVNNVINVNVDAGKSFYILGLPEGTTYVVDELHENNYDYTFDYAEINDYSCVIVDAEATVSGTIDKGRVDGMNYYNIPVSYGALIISKEVVHPYEASYQIPDSIEFEVEVLLEGDRLNTAFEVVSSNGTTAQMTPVNGKLTLTIKDDESISIYGLPEGTEYTVNEINLPDGFALGRNSTGLNGVISSAANSEASLINNYSPASVEVPLLVNVDKTLSGRDFLEGETYTFVLYDGLGNELDRVSGTATAGGALNASFAQFTETFNAVGTYEYKVAEVNDSIDGNGVPGVTYDDTIHYFTVTVTDNMTGRLMANVTSSTATVSNGTNSWVVDTSFNNDYNATENADVTIDITKEIVSTMGESYPLNGFKFALFDAQGNVYGDESVTDSQGNASISLAFTPDNIGDIFVLTLKEINTNIPGMLYDETEYTVEIEVIDNLDGTVGVRINGEDTNTYSASFTNTYTPGVASVVISGNKVFEGRDVLDTDNFTFVLKDSEGKIIDTTSVANGGFAFGVLSYETIGVYTYTVSEELGDIKGVTYDTTVYTVVVTVVDEGDGVLVPSTVIYLDRAEVEGIEFTNVYSASSVDAVIEGEKVLVGKDLAEGDYSFELYDSEGNLIKSVVNGADGKFSFSAIEFIEAGVYNFEVSEVIGNLGGVTYDTSVYNVVVTVTDNLEGQLVASVAYYKNNEESENAAFTNIYSVSANSIVINGDKVLVGRDMNEGEFSFELYDSEGNLIESVVNGADGKFSFSAIEFTEAGVYNFKVSEVIGSLGGVTYDTTTYDVVVTVIDNLEGEFEITVEYLNDEEAVEAIIFTNVYSVPANSVIINGDKVLVGRDMNESEFSFELYDSEGNLIESVVNGANGKFSFSAIEFTEAGVYNFKVSEVIGSLGGVTYDTTTYDVVVTVIDNLEGEFEITVEYLNDEEAVESIIFTNSYSASSESVVIEGEKVLTGKDLAEGEFEFVLKDSEGNVIESKLNGADGKFAFSAIVFDTVGEYVYTVSELNTNGLGIEYDASVYTVAINVTDNLEGKLVADVSISKDDADAEAIVFNNNYAPVELNIPVEIQKVVENLTKENIGANGFRFILESNGKEIAKATSDINGKAIFMLSFTDADLGETFTYKISEVNGGMAGMNYSQAVYELVVKVVTDENGELAAVVTMNGSSDNLVAEFVNTYVGIPDTGDNTTNLIWIAMLAICSGAVISMFKRSKKEQAI